MSESTVDRMLRGFRRKEPGHEISRTKPGVLLKKAIPVRTFSELDESKPGFLEIDLVAHCGDSAEGFYLTTLSAVDVASGGHFCVPYVCTRSAKRRPESQPPELPPLARCRRQHRRADRLGNGGGRHASHHGRAGHWADGDVISNLKNQISKPHLKNKKWVVLLILASSPLISALNLEESVYSSPLMGEVRACPVLRYGGQGRQEPVYHETSRI
jgi:hypothetical protein